MTTIIEQFESLTHCRDCVHSSITEWSPTVFCKKHTLFLETVLKPTYRQVDGDSRCDFGMWLFIGDEDDYAVPWDLKRWLEEAHVVRYKLTLVPRDKWPFWVDGDREDRMVGKDSE